MLLMVEVEADEGFGAYLSQQTRYGLVARVSHHGGLDRPRNRRCLWIGMGVSLVAWERDLPRVLCQDVQHYSQTDEVLTTMCVSVNDLSLMLMCG